MEMVKNGFHTFLIITQKSVASSPFTKKAIAMMMIAIFLDQ
ncbi:MAG: hypothetical protein VKL41_17785 [Snowella sp.]|nr:hypothetical protein [Snowella sp.]